MPDRETGGLPDLSERGGAALVCTLWPAGFGGGSLTTGWGASVGSVGARLGGATLPLEEIVTFGFAAAGSAVPVVAAAALDSGSTCGAARAAGAFAAGTAGLLESATTSAAGFLATTGLGRGASAAGFLATATGALASALAVCGSAVSGSATTTGSGGGGGFSSPSRSALRRTRSAWASTMLEECDLTPMLSAKQRSSVFWLVSPSSLASSWTRILPGNGCLLQDGSARPLDPGALPGSNGHACCSLAISPGSTSARKARANARRRLANSKQAMSAHSQAPRPGPGPTTRAPLGSMRTRLNSAPGRRVRQPIQVRTGLSLSPPARWELRPRRNRKPRGRSPPPAPRPWPPPTPPR